MTLEKANPSEAWLFTSRQGTVLKRSSKTVGDDIPDKFAHACAGEGGEVTIYYASGDAQAVPPHRVPEFIEDLGEEVLAIRQEPPGGISSWFEARFSLDANGITHSVRTTQAGVGRSKEVDVITDRLAQHLARNTGVRVMRMKLSFATDTQTDKLWLINVSKIVLASDAKTGTQASGGLLLPSSKAKTKSQRRCVGAFCQYDEQAQRLWLTRELPLPNSSTSDASSMCSSSNGFATSSDHSKTREDEDDPSLLAGKQIRPSDDMHKIAYRAVLHAEEPHTLQSMDPLLRVYTLRQRASISRLRAITRVDLPRDLDRSRGVPVIPQDASFTLEWEWTGPVAFVDISLVSYDGETRMPLARGCRNAGTLRLHFPMICPDWASSVRPWALVVSDSIDHRVEKATCLVALAGPLSASQGLPTIPRHWSSLAWSEPDSGNHGRQYSFADPKKLSNYHKTVAVCSTCYEIYQRLTATRLELEEEKNLDSINTDSLQQTLLADPLQIDHHLPSSRFLPIVSESQTARSTENKNASLDKPQPRRTQSADAFFARLAAPKKASEECDFQDARNWSSGFNLRKSSSSLSSSHTGRNPEVALKRRSRRKQSKEPHHQAPRPLRKTLQRHNSHGRFGHQNEDSRLESGAQDGIQYFKKESQKVKKAKAKVKSRLHPKNNTQDLLMSASPFQAGNSQVTVAACRPLRLQEVATDSDLFKVLCFLGLTSYEHMRSALRTIKKQSLASLAYSCVVDDKLQINDEAALRSQSNSGTSFEALLQRSLKGRQTLALLKQYLAIPKTFVSLMKSCEQDSMPEQHQLDTAVQVLQGLCALFPGAMPRLHILRGFKAQCAGDTKVACDHWSRAVADAARFDGMWSYNVGVAHLLLGRALQENMNGSHSSAAAAIFRRLGATWEFNLVQDPLTRTRGGSLSSPHSIDYGENHDAASLSRRSDGNQNDSSLEGGKHDADDGDDDDDAEETAALLRWARQAIESVESELQRRGRRRQLPRSPAEKEVWRLVDAARADMEIFQDSDSTSVYFAHRRARVKDAVEMLEAKMSRLFREEQQSRGGPRQHQSEDQDLELSTDSSDEEATDNDEEEEESDQDDEEWTQRYGAPILGKEIFRFVRERDAKALEKIFRRDSANIRVTDTAGNTVLHAAAKENWIDGIHVCLSAGVDIDAQNLQGDTPLHLASSAVRTLLIALGADSKLCNNYGVAAGASNGV